MGTDVFVPVTMKVEPSELATIEAIAKASGRSRSDVMREMLSYGLEHVMERAFAGSPTFGAGEGSGPKRTVVSTVLPPESLSAVDALVDAGMGTQSAVVRQAIEEGLRLAGYGEEGADDAR